MNTAKPSSDTCTASTPTALNPLISDKEEEVLKHLRDRRRERIRTEKQKPHLGDRIADQVAALVGSWRFVIIQSIVLALWIVLNLMAWFQSWDPYPFILLNLFLSFQAAYTAPVIMMSQNRQAVIDRKKAEEDYDTNLKAELEIEWLHQKIDILRQDEIKRLQDEIGTLIKTVEKLSQALADQSASEAKRESRKI